MWYTELEILRLHLWHRRGNHNLIWGSSQFQINTWCAERPVCNLLFPVGFFPPNFYSPLRSLCFILLSAETGCPSEKKAGTLPAFHLHFKTGKRNSVTLGDLWYILKRVSLEPKHVGHDEGNKQDWYWCCCHLYRPKDVFSNWHVPLNHVLRCKKKKKN